MNDQFHVMNPDNIYVYLFKANHGRRTIIKLNQIEI